MKKIGLIVGSVISIMAQDIYATFNVEAIRQSAINVEAKAIIKKINVDVGSWVKKGDILLELSNNDLRSSLAMSVVDKKYAQKSLKRFKALKDVVDKELYEKYEYKVELLNATINYKIALLEKTVLRAPYDGLITGKFVQLGEMAEKKSFTIMDSSKVKLILLFDEQYWNTVKKGLKFKYRVDGIDKERVGTISKVYPVADTKSRMIKAEVITKGLTPGLFGHGKIEVK